MLHPRRALRPADRAVGGPGGDDPPGGRADRRRPRRAHRRAALADRRRSCLAVVFVGFQLVENHFLYPVVMSRTVRMNPLWVLLAVLVGANLGGVFGSALGALAGALVAIPVGGAIQVIVPGGLGPRPGPPPGRRAAGRAIRTAWRCGRRRAHRCGVPGSVQVSVSCRPSATRLVVLPTYNESENIDRVLRTDPRGPARGHRPGGRRRQPRRDGRPGRDSWARTSGAIEILRRDGKSGLGSAYRAGFRWGLDHGFDACVEMDADLSHDPEALPGPGRPARQGLRAGRWAPGTSPGARSRTGPGTAGSCPGAGTSTPRPCSVSAWPIRPRGSGPTPPRCSGGSTSTASGPTATGSRSR